MKSIAEEKQRRPVNKHRTHSEKSRISEKRRTVENAFINSLGR